MQQSLLSSLGKGGKDRSMELILGRGKGGKSMELILGRVKSHLFSLLVLIAPKSVLECLGAGPRLSLSLFCVILGWLLFSFSPRIGRSNTNFC